MCGTQAQEETLAALNWAIEQNPQDSRAIARRGEMCRLAGRYEEALADFSRAIALQPDYAWAIAHRGETYYLLKRYREALADFNRAVELNPTNAWTLAHRGASYDRMERYEEALADLNRAIELNPTYAWAFAYRCRAYEMMGRYEEALVNFDQAIALDQTIIKDWITERGLLLSFVGRYAEGMEYYERALREQPDNHLTLYCIAFTKTRWKGLAQTKPEIDKARAVLESQLNQPDVSAVLYELGGLAALEGQTDEALNYLQEAMSLDYMPKRRALHDLAWLDLYSDPRFLALVGESPPRKKNNMRGGK
jgi:tetratricopeptide (TPR) repeat protein